MPQQQSASNRKGGKNRPQQTQTHLAARRAPNVRPITAPMAVGAKLIKNYFDISQGPSKYPGSIKIKGCDFLKAVSQSASTAAGTTLFNLWLSPTGEDFVGTRLHKFGHMYDKYLFKKIRFHVLADNASTSNGSVLSAFDKDIGDETPPANAQGLQQFNSMLDCARSKVWENHTLEVRLTDPQDWYYTNYIAGVGDMRVAYQGQYYLVQLSTSSSACTYQVWVEYDIELYDPQIESSSAEVGLKATNNTPSTTVNAGLNSVTAQNVSSLIKFGTDSANNKYLEVPEGNYALFQSFVQATSAGTPSMPNVIANIASKQGEVVKTNLDVQGASAGGNALRNDLFTIPPGGAKLYTSFDSWATGVLGAYIVRMMQATPSWK